MAHSTDKGVEEGPQKNQTNHALVDQEVAKYATDSAIEVDEATSKRLKRMIDKRVLVVMMVTYLIQTLDKGALSFASIMGIIDDTNLQGNQYQWLTTVVYLAVLIVEFPENWVIQRVPIAKWLSLNIFLWGICIALIAAANNFTSLIILRAFMGAFEAVCQPTFVLLSATWYKREEQSSVINIWFMMNGLQNIIGGLLAFGFSFIPSSSPIKSWQSLFMTYGILTVGWGIFVGIWMPDSPMRAKCWSEEDKRLIIERVRQNQTGLQNRVFRWEQVRDAFTDPQLCAFAIIQICTTIPAGGIGAYANIIIKSFGFSTRESQLLTMVNGTVTTIALIMSAYLDRKFQQTIYIMIGSLVPSIICTSVLVGVPFSPSRRVGLLIAYWTFYSFMTLSSLSLALLSRNVAGQTKKSVIIASNFVCWAAGNSIGPQVFRDKDAPRYYLAFSILLGCFVVAFTVLCALRVWYAMLNRMREARIASGDVVPDINYTHAFEDITDRENPHFRYIY
ncbi:major facilitator superfamily domain-containing protein [Aspergillus pseudoustus]|uniref:Major facilitator superfamily domain-containing protein n=1 Tax=Aspergillus pseudoustus TaxID=1810923 RepID=A0ABR4KGW8_9EURO